MRRKLDFDVIKDNHENKVTKEIINRFADLDAGLPGTNFKYQRIQGLIDRRRAEIERHIAEARLKKRMDRELARTKTKEGRRAIEAIDAAVRDLARDPRREAWVREWRGDRSTPQDLRRLNAYMDERARGGPRIE